MERLSSSGMIRRGEELASFSRLPNRKAARCYGNPARGVQDYRVPIKRTTIPSTAERERERERDRNAPEMETKGKRSTRPDLTEGNVVLEEFVEWERDARAR